MNSRPNVADDDDRDDGGDQDGKLNAGSASSCEEEISNGFDDVVHYFFIF